MRYFFEIYEYFMHICFIFIDILPVFFRKIFFKLVLGSCGTRVMIDRKVYFRYPSKISVGDRCSINRGGMFFASAHTEDKINIMIGNHVVFGPNVTIFTAGHDPQTINLANNYGRVTIEDDVWIGGNATILQGVTIHEGAVIGAGSVVAKDVPAYTICIGNPAKVVKERKIVG